MAVPKKSSTKRTTSHKAESPTESCFVMMSFTQLPKSYYDLVFKPAIEAAGLGARRADDIYTPSPIISDIWREVRAARVMLADLTFRNPNVMYELGLAHALGKPVVMLTQALPDVPFDLQSYRVIPYSPIEPDWAATLEKQITRTMREVLKAPAKWVLPVFLHERAGGDQPAVAPFEKRLTSLERLVERIEAQVRTRNLATFQYPPANASWGAVTNLAKGLVGSSTASDPLNSVWSGGFTVPDTQHRLAAMERALGTLAVKTEKDKPNK